MSNKNKSKHPLNNPPADPHKERSKEETTNRHVYIEPGVQIDLVPDLKTKYDATQESNATHSSKVLFWTKVSALLLFAYAGLAAWQGYLTRTAIGDARDSFIKDHAPYVWVEVQPPTVAAGSQVRWDIKFSNYGRSPALHLHSCIRSGWGTDGMKFMNIITDDLIHCKGQLQSESSESVIPPGLCSYATSTGPRILSDKNAQDISGIDGGANVWGIFWYDDASGHSYETTFCAYRMATGAVSHCSKWNNIMQTK